MSSTVPDSSGGLTHVGPHPSHVIVAKNFIKQWEIEKMLKQTGVSEASDAALRLQGVSWIQSVREALKMFVELPITSGAMTRLMTPPFRPVQTYETACILYHKFRLMHNDKEYSWVVRSTSIPDASRMLTIAGCRSCRALHRRQDRGHAQKVPRHTLRRIQPQPQTVQRKGDV
jgi:hypothetical protein